MERNGSLHCQLLTNTMILRRLGNKQAIAQDIIKHFPEHTFYVEPFFGAGGIFFNKRKAKYNILNDLDSDVFNLFMVCLNRKAELKEAFYTMPIHSDLLAYWQKNQETDPIKKALRFLLMSNFTLYGAGETIRHQVSGGVDGVKNFKDEFESKLEATNKMLYDCSFTNFDFRKFLIKLGFKHEEDRNKTFIYCDPPYLDTTNNYSNSFCDQDCLDLLDCLEATKCKFAISEFDNEFILNQAKQRGLNIHVIGERQNIKNRRVEILITNYEKQKLLFY